MSLFLCALAKSQKEDSQGKCILDIYCCSRFHINGLGGSRLEEHDLGIVELTVIDPYRMVPVSHDLKAEPSVQSIAPCSLGSDIDPIQEYLIAAHSFRDYYGSGISSGWRRGSSGGGGRWGGDRGRGRGGEGSSALIFRGIVGRGGSGCRCGRGGGC